MGKFVERHRTPEHRPARTRVTLAPHATWIAEYDLAAPDAALRVVDYARGAEIGRLPVSGPPIELGFSPSERRLFAISQFRDRVAVASAPWGADGVQVFEVPHERRRPTETGAYGAAWLDDRRLLVAGCQDRCGALWVAVYDAEASKLTPVDDDFVPQFSLPDGTRATFSFLDCAACSPTGKVAFGMGARVIPPYVGVIGIHEVDAGQNRIANKRHVIAEGSSGIALELAWLDDERLLYGTDASALRVVSGATIVSACAIGGHPRDKRVVCAAGHVLAKRSSPRAATRVYRHEAGEFELVGEVAGEGGIGTALSAFDQRDYRDMDCAWRKDGLHVAIGGERATVIYELAE